MRRSRGCLWLAAGLIVALIAGLVAFMALNRATMQRAGAAQEVAQVDVVVATARVPVRTVLTADVLRIKQIPVNAVPDGALRSLDQAVGKITTLELFPEEVLLVYRLLDPNVIPPDARMALVLDGDKVLMAFPAEDLLSRTGVLKAGDRVDLLVTLTFPIDRSAVSVNQEDRLAGFSLLQNLTIAAIVGEPLATATQGAMANAAQPSALLLTVSPQEALILKYVRDAGGRVDVVLRAPGVDGPFAVEPVDWNYLIDKYKIPTGVDFKR